MSYNERPMSAAERFPIGPARIARRLEFSDPKAYAKVRLELASDDVNSLENQIDALCEQLERLQARAETAREVCRSLAEDFRRDWPEPAGNGTIQLSDRETNFGSY